MNDLSLFSILRSVITDYRVIAAFVTVLLYLNFIFYVVRYKKKKGGSKKRLVKIKAAAPAPAAENAEAGSETEEGNSEADTGE
ncbi:hypothetical protein V1L52_04000 [Treponema sp. HNW]|uniref:hypothetical protein n=1 Tax=Treponema sp. HNW TaxID=3116654 RepID=UPI003D0C5BBD